MSKKRHKIEAFSENARKRKSRRSPDESNPTTLTMKEKFIVIGVPVSIVLGLLILTNYASMKSHRKVIDARIKRWQVEHRLSDEEVTQLKKIEYDFHGTGMLSLFRGKPSHEEQIAHKEAVDEFFEEVIPVDDLD